jgi:hypothetical protein
MSDRVEMSNVRVAMVLLAALIPFAALIVWFTAWEREANNQKVSEVTPLRDTNATRIAIDEVKNREGWSGFVDDPPPTQKEVFWFVAVWRKPMEQPRSLDDRRYVVLDGESGKVLDYGRGRGRPAPNRKKP